jgi:allophanate hydrolase
MTGGEVGAAGWSGGVALDLRAQVLARSYADGSLTPVDMVEQVLAAIAARSVRYGDEHVWIDRVPQQDLLRAAARLAERRAAGEDLPLFGLPFAVKGNIDVAGFRTTAACPTFGEVPARSAHVVRRLEATGALLVGTTNLDQFATGLSGARSPYGTPANPVYPGLIPGGSSSGSGAAVAAGLVTFAIGTDTAGSGRVPAALTSTVGLKPSRGLVGTSGIVPACRSLDCPSIHAGSVDEALLVLSVLAGPDPDDAWSRPLPVPAADPPVLDPGLLRLGVPALLNPDGQVPVDPGIERAFTDLVARAEAAGATVVPIDLEPFLAAGSLLYGGPWVAERLADLGEFVDAHPRALHQVTAEVLRTGHGHDAVDAFRGLHRLQGLAHVTRPVWREIDALMLPTVPTTFTVDEMLADPVTRNSVLGRFTTFVNLLDLAALAVPAGVTETGRPFGVTLVGPAASDAMLAGVAVGLRPRVLSPSTAAHAGAASPGPAVATEDTLLAVVGAHLSGLPLNHQLVERGARLVTRTVTAPEYRLYALPGGPPARPGLLRAPGSGTSIEVEVYRIDHAGLGSLLATVPAPLAIGSVTLAGGDVVRGFVCEPYGLGEAVDVTAFGGWRTYARSDIGSPPE